MKIDYIMFISIRYSTSFIFCASSLSLNNSFNVHIKGFVKILVAGFPKTLQGCVDTSEEHFSLILSGFFFDHILVKTLSFPSFNTVIPLSAKLCYIARELMYEIPSR